MDCVNRAMLLGIRILRAFVGVLREVTPGSMPGLLFTRAPNHADGIHDT